MERRNILATIKNEMDDHIGEKVTLRANNGRRKIIVSNGILEKTYSSIFVVRLEDDTQRTVTYSYSDVLTKTVQIDFAG
ncbi:MULTISPECIES: Veg family protein [Clostridium]|uniref:Veg protein n=2 Tax=Clostridium TaxID=1485 RepID=A0A151APD1_9CLOT|nr:MULTISPECIES: Veg family protein [Clostridium]KYH29420.1 hypothetical protein CLCOL_11680 [Clostridium colicanis DSM 13634]PRR70798.1 hypothetical protein CPAL_18830 [Clostridium thermopalmarium DSM 5974]PVZ28722.1 uncharacterized protein Veg [Clostridium thermopalmarium DSM 5974]